MVMRVLSITIVLLIAGFSIRAQNPIVTPLQQFMDFKLFAAEVTIRTLYNEYEVKGQINPYYKNTSSISMINWADTLNWTRPPINFHQLLPIEPKDIDFDMPKIHQIVMEVLEPKRTQLVSNKEIISISCEIDTAGRIGLIRSFTMLY